MPVLNDETEEEEREGGGAMPKVEVIECMGCCWGSSEASERRESSGSEEEEGRMEEREREREEAEAEMEGRRRDFDAVVLRLVVRVGPVVDLRRSRSLSSPTASWLSLSETAQEPEPDSASAIDSALDEVCTPLPPSTDTGAAEVGEETLMASEEMEEPRRRWASVRGAVPCEGSKGAKGLMRALEGERGEVALGDEGPATRELGQDTKKIDEKPKERTVRGDRHLGRGAYRAGERGRRREDIGWREGALPLLLLDVRGEGRRTRGGCVKSHPTHSSDGVVPAVHRVMHVRREGASPRGGGDEVEVNVVSHTHAHTDVHVHVHAHLEGVTEGEEAVGVEVGGEEGVEEGIVCKGQIGESVRYRDEIELDWELDARGEEEEREAEVL